MKMKKFIIICAFVAIAAIAGYLVYSYFENRIYNDPAFAHGNGRLEATEVNIATKLSERVEAVDVEEGELVQKGQLLARMQTNVLKAQLAQAKAHYEQAKASKLVAEATIQLRKSELEAARADLERQESNFEGAEKRYERAKKLRKNNAMSEQQYENDETYYLSTKSELVASRAKVGTAEASLAGAEAELAGAEANIHATQADVDRIQADIDDSQLLAPLAGRIQYRIAEPGEVLAAGGKVLNLVDLTDVYMTFFLPEIIAGKVKIGADVRIVLDAIPDVPVPAKVTFVASVAQFTPKTVETQVERQKLMFRIKAHVDPVLLSKYIEYVKTGLPGVAWVRLDDSKPWPDFLKLKSER